MAGDTIPAGTLQYVQEAMQPTTKEEQIPEPQETVISATLHVHAMITHSPRQEAAALRREAAAP